MDRYPGAGENIPLRILPSTSQQQPRHVMDNSLLGDLPSNNYNSDFVGNLQQPRGLDGVMTFEDRSRAANNALLNLPSHRGLGDESTLLDSEPGGSRVQRRAKLIVSEMGRDSVFMDDNPLAEQLRLETLREMPESLTLKRTIRKELGNTVSRKSRRKKVGLGKHLKYTISVAFNKMTVGLRNLVTGWEPGYQSLKVIEGHFGSGVVTYFKYLRWLLFLNLGVCILSFCFVVLPQLFYNPNEVPGVVTPIPNTTTMAAMQKSISPFSFSDIFTGEGYLTESILFYGYFANESVSSTPGLSYSIPHAYFFTALCTYILAFIVVSTSMARSYRVTFIQTSVGGLKHVYAHKVFCSWDFSIATQQAADLKSTSIANEIKELLSEERIEETGWRQRLVQWAVHGLCVALVAGMAYLTWILLTLRETMLVSVVVTLALIAAPLFFSLLLRFEGYRNPRTALYVTLFRMFILQVVIVAMVVAFWLDQAAKTTQCWETALAQEIYRLVLMDFWVAILATSLVEFLRSRLPKAALAWVGEPEFDIASNTLGLIYTQTLLWAGAFFSPFLPLIVVIKMFITFHVRRAGVMHNCVPARRAWRAAQTNTFFLALSFLALVILLSTLGYIITQVRPSVDCGPFRDFDYVYEMVLLKVLNLQKDNGFWRFVLFLTKPGVVAGFLIAIGAGVYYVRSRAQAQHELVELLQEMLRLEASDKEFLLAKISKLTQSRRPAKQTSSEDSTRGLLLRRMMRYPESGVSSSVNLSNDSASDDQILEQSDDELNDYEGAKIRNLRRKHIRRF